LPNAYRLNSNLSIFYIFIFNIDQEHLCSTKQKSNNSFERDVTLLWWI